MRAVRALACASAIALFGSCVVNTKDYPLARSNSSTGGSGTGGNGGHLAGGGAANGGTAVGTSGQSAGGCDATSCTLPSCRDTIQDQDETDVDCGGVCAPGVRCADGKGCRQNADCLGNGCTSGTCVTPAGTIALVDSDAGGKGSSAFTVSHTLKTSSGHSRMVVIAVGAEGNSATGATPNTVTYDGIAATLAQAIWSGNQVRSGIYYLDDATLPPSAGTYLIEIGAFEFAAAVSVLEFTGVNQANPISAVGGGTGRDCCCDDPSDTIAISIGGSWVVGSVATFGAGQGTALSGQTALEPRTVGGLGLLAGYRGPETTTGSTTISWDMLSCNDSAHALVALEPN